MVPYVWGLFGRAPDQRDGGSVPLTLNALHTEHLVRIGREPQLRHRWGL